MYKMYTNPFCCLLTWSDALDTIQCISCLPEGVSKIIKAIYNKPKYFKMNCDALSICNYFNIPFLMNTVLPKFICYLISH